MSERRILMIEDELDFLKALQTRLESDGYEVLTAHDGFDGLNIARKNNPDLIILDVMIPKINGFKVCRLLKYDDSYKQIPIIMIPVRTETEDKRFGEETGCDLFLTKPLNTDQLVESLEKLLISDAT